MAQRYLKRFLDEQAAASWARMKTQAHAGGDGQVFCWVEGPSDDWMVCDLQTAIASHLPYQW